MTRNLVFLDMDGVLNTVRSMDRAREQKPGTFPPENAWFHTVDPKCVLNLRRAFERIKKPIDIVVSSSWRFSGLDVVSRALAWGGWPAAPILSKTTENFLEHKENIRGSEIGHWLQTEVEPGVDIRYAILDDNDDMLSGQLPFFIRTEFNEGFTPVHTEKLIALFS